MSEKKSIKDIVMAKNTGNVTLDSTALSVVLNPQTKKWCLVEIPFNVEHNEVGKLKVLEEDQSRHLLIDRFKMLAVQKNIVV